MEKRHLFERENQRVRLKVMRRRIYFHYVVPVPSPVIKHRQSEVYIENIRQIPVFSKNEKLLFQQQNSL